MPDIRYKRPESVLVVVYARTGEVLLLRRREPPDFWQSVTGSLGWEETPDEAARRELAEETGIGADEALVETGRVNRFPIMPQWRARYAPGVTENVEHVFALRLEAPRPVRLDPDEHLEHAWLPWADAAQRASSWTNRDAIRAVAGDGPGA